MVKFLYLIAESYSVKKREPANRFTELPAGYPWDNSLHRYQVTGCSSAEPDIG
jgi:hypothetical protein